MSDDDIFDPTAAYKTLAGFGEAEITVDRSRFIGHAMPVDSEDEAEAYVEEMKSEHYDARHVCYGLRVGRGAQGIDRSNDDGEPPRTGGFPIWQVLDGEEITDALGVVIRYYGGVKLGTGGLARAYRETARQAIEAAGVVTVYPEEEMTFSLPYDLHGKVEHLLAEADYARTVDSEFAGDVTLTVAVRLQNAEQFRQQLARLMNCDPEDVDQA